MPDPVADTTRELIARYFDGELTDAESLDLREALLTNPAARAVFTAYAVNRRLVPTCAKRETGDTQPANRSTARAASAGRTNPLRIALSLAAALLLAAAAVTIYFFASNPQSEVRNPKSQNRIATVIDATGDLIVNQDVANPGEEYERGDYTIESGSAQLLLSNRVGVSLHGKTRLTMHSPMSATLSSGSASFNCPPGTVGYTVHLLDGSKIVDLGTAFRVSVDDRGRAEVRVTEGRVRWESPIAGVEPIELAAGQVASIADGRASSDRAILRVNLGPAGLPEEPGFVAWTTPGDRTAFQPTTILGVRLSLVDVVNDNGPVRSILRSDTFDGEMDRLTQTWWGARALAGNPGGALAIAINGSDLGAGDFRWTSWHHDHRDQTGRIDIELSTDGGATYRRAVRDFDIIDYEADQNAGAPNPVSFTFASNGVDSVIVRFKNVGASSREDDFVVINGFEIASLTPPPPTVPTETGNETPPVLQGDPE